MKAHDSKRERLEKTCNRAAPKHNARSAPGLTANCRETSNNSWTFLEEHRLGQRFNPNNRRILQFWSIWANFDFKQGKLILKIGETLFERRRWIICDLKHKRRNKTWKLISLQYTVFFLMASHDRDGDDKSTFQNSREHTVVALMIETSWKWTTSNTFEYWPDLWCDVESTSHKMDEIKRACFVFEFVCNFKLFHHRT